MRDRKAEKNVSAKTHAISHAAKHFEPAGGRKRSI